MGAASAGFRPNAQGAAESVVRRLAQFVEVMEGNGVSIGWMI